MGVPFATVGVFSTSHIALTAIIAGVIACAAAYSVLGRGSALTESVVIGLLTAATVFLWRKSANMPQLNIDGLREFSANDWLAPAMTFVVLGVYGAWRRDGNDRAFAKARALAVVAAFIVNVVAI